MCNNELIELVVVVVVNFIKHQNRAITGERVAARAAPTYSSSRVRGDGCSGSQVQCWQLRGPIRKLLADTLLYKSRKL